MLRPRPLIVLLLTVSLLLLSACAVLLEEEVDSQKDIDQQVHATLTEVAQRKEIEAARETATARAAVTDTPRATYTPPATSTPTLIPTSTATPSPTRTPTPAHVQIPSGPTGRNTFVTDLITVDLAEDKTAVGDNYAWSKMERPYTAQTMEYRPYLDIMRVDMQVRDPWVYLTFILIGDLPPEGDVRYAVELDTDHEGRGEILVMAALPPDAEWTTDGVLVMEDANQDIGGVFPLYHETPQPGQDGYEQERFANGQGEDRDLAWVRRDPEKTNQIQLAFKRDLLGLQGVLWSAWTDAGIKDPGLFDFNDHITFEEAGSPNKGNYRYPLKAVAQVDSTCRSWYGFVPSGEEPGLCFTGQQPADEPSQGFCVANLAAAGCQSACYRKCPEGEQCRPCQLP